MNELALFAGHGGGILGGHLLGWRTICAVEWDASAASNLVVRQNDKTLRPFPIWDDVQTFDGRPWRGIVDVVSGGFPCQDISVAGKGAGISGKRSGLWLHMARIIGEVRPRFVFIENSPALRKRGLATVLKQLTQMGYNGCWGVVGARHAIAYSGHRCADHARDRLWIVGKISDSYGLRKLQSQGSQQNERGRTSNICSQVADSLSKRLETQGSKFSTAGITGNSSEVANANGAGLERLQRAGGSDPQGRKEPDGSVAKCGDVCNAVCRGLPQPESESMQEWAKGGAGERSCTPSASWWAVEPDVGRVAHGVAHRVDRIRGLGNGQVPAVAALAWRILSAELQRNQQ